MSAKFLLLVQGDVWSCFLQNTARELYFSAFTSLLFSLYYRDVKTNKTYSKDVANLEFIKYFGRIYNLTSLYKEIYKDENIFNINNPTSTFM